MGTGRICECCLEFTSLLQSYDGRRTPLNRYEDINVSREEVETVILFIQSWTQRQCSCCFRDPKNFERFNWAIQILVLIVVEIVRHLKDPGLEGRQRKSSETLSAANESVESVQSGEQPISVSKDVSASGDEDITDHDEREADRPLWDVNDKEKLIHFVAKVFVNSFPTYVAYKQHMQVKNEEITAQEIQALSQFCEINEPEASPYLFRNVTLFCRARGMEVLGESISGQSPETMPLHQVNILVTLAANVKTWMNFQSILKYYVPFRSFVLGYMCKLVDTELKTVSARNMADEILPNFQLEEWKVARIYKLCTSVGLYYSFMILEYMWSAVKDPIDAHLSFDKDGLDLAFKYFLSSTLTMRLSGVNHINSYINLFNELLNSNHVLDADTLDNHLCRWLLDNQIIQHIFGPNLHVEVIKQSHTILSFLALENKISNEHVEIIWQAAQLKHCSKQVYDILSSLICNMEPGPVIHLHNLLKKLEPKDHTEQSLYLASALLKFIWTNAAAALEEQHLAIAGHASIKSRGRSRSRVVELSSSENSVSVEASHSEDEIQGPSPVGIGVGISQQSSVLNEIPEASMERVHQFFKPGHPCKLPTATSSSEDSLSEDGEGSQSGKSNDPDSVQLSSSGYVETHSDSDADEERSGNEENVPSARKKPKRKVLRRKSSKSSGKDGKRVKEVPSLEKKGGVEITELSSQNHPQGPGSSGAPKPSPMPESPNSIDKTHGPLPPMQGVLEPGDPMDSSAVISRLDSLVQMADHSSLLQGYVEPDLMDGSDGSYSSRMSTKSEKNMADFDGEDSNCEEELMQTLTQNQLVELAARNQVRMGGLGAVYGPRSMRRFCRRKKFQSPGSFNFQIENVCQPGETLLWDLIQDEKICQLSEGLIIEAQKALTNLLCFNTDKFIRFKFIEGCIENIANNKAVVVSLRLLPKLLTSFNQLRLTGDMHQVTIWADREHHMMDKFFANLRQFKAGDVNVTVFPYHQHVQTRLEFLSVVFSMMGSPEEFRLSTEQVGSLWESLATDTKCSDDLFVWLTGQVRMRDQHALSHQAFRFILLRKLPSLPPETITVHSLTLFQQLINLARISGLQEDAAEASMDYLWKIALYANNTDVSMTAIQYLNNYYIGRQLEKEEEFVERCMSHLADATKEVNHTNLSDEAPLLRIQRALLLLKTHLEIFRKRYAYHLRKWFLEGKGVGSHAQLVGEKGAVSVRVVIQPAGFHDKVTLELSSTDYVADLRAEVAKWWENVQGNLAIEKSSSTPVLGSLLTEGPIRMITQGSELSAEYDEKCLGDVPIKDLQLVYVSMGATRPQKKKESLEYSSSLVPPPRDKLPVTLLLQPQYFEQLFCLMQSLTEIKTTDRAGASIPHTKAQVLSRRVWDILMLLPTNPSIHEGFTNIAGANQETFCTLLDPMSPQKLMYSLYIVEALVKMTHNKKELASESSGSEINSWKQQFVERGGLRHLFDIFSSGVLESVDGSDWSEWKQDCLASLLKILCYLGVISEDTEYLNEQLYDVNEIPKKRVKRRKISTEKSPIPRLNETMLSMMEVELVMTRLTNILQSCSLPRDPNHYKTGFWGRAQVVHYAMALLVCWAFSSEKVRSTLYSQNEFPIWLRRLVLEDPEPAVRREVCMGLYRLCLGVSVEGKTGISYAPELISHLLKSLSISLCIRSYPRYESPVPYDDGKEPYGPACRDYFWLLGRLLDSLEEKFVKESLEHPDSCPIDLDSLAATLSNSILNREYFETRHNTVCDDGLVGLISVTTVVMKHNPPFKSSKIGLEFLKRIFDCLFALPSPQQRYLPKCKSQPSRSSAYDLLAEMARSSADNYYLLQNLLMDQHQPSSHNPYVWDYWPHEDGRAPCGYVGLTNLGATCYMASCMQHLYMMPQARASILSAKFTSEYKHEQTLRELQKMFAYLMESERKAYNPRSFCKVYQMDHKPLNTGEQKDMAEFFIDLVSKLEEMTPELKQLVKTLFCGVTSNNVVSLDCPHVSRTLEEFYTVRCQVADMRSIFESLDEVTVKDTLEGDNMYTCSTCGKKVRAEKRACFKKLPHILCFNTMRYTFNMITMMKEKVNTHFSFPLHLDMSGYVEKTLMPQQYQEEKAKRTEMRKEGDLDEVLGSGIEDDESTECYTYDLIGVTVHTGTADGGHYYSFIRDRLPPNKDKWYLFNDAEVKQFDPNQIPAECFGGEMSTKTYDTVTDKFLDFSFEKTNSAYMLFYERSNASQNALLGMGGDNMLLPSLPGGSSQNKPTQPPAAPEIPSFELNKELEDWIWMDNTQFLKDKNIFEHTYFNFMHQVCGQIPVTLLGQEHVLFLAAKLSTTFFLETFIHAKEKPTMVQWIDLLTKQLILSPDAAVWFLDHLADSDWWLTQILLKCPNQMVRQMFQRLCLNVVQHVRPSQYQLFLKVPESQASDHPNDANIIEFGSFSCVTRFLKRYLTLLDQGAKSHLKHLAEYFTFLHDFSRLGDEECLFLINIQAISKMVGFYLGNKKEDQGERSNGEHPSEEEEDEEEIISIPTEKNKVTSLEKMIALIASLVEKSRDDSNSLRLSSVDLNSLTGGGKSFPFILQQIRDGINFMSTRNLIFSLCRWNEKLAENIVVAIFQAIQKHPDLCQPYFKVLNLLSEFYAGPPELPKFTELILYRLLDVSEICPYPTLEWLGTQVPRNPIVQQWCLQSKETWVEHFLMANNNQRVRNAAATLLVSLVPSQQFRQGYRSTKFYGGHHTVRDMVTLSPEANNILHEIYICLLQLLKPARHYTDINSHGTSKLVSYFSVLTYFTVSKVEKILFGPFFADLWNLFHPRLSEPSIPCHHNKAALLTFWHHVCLDCSENIQRIVQNPVVVKQIGFNYILADHEDQEVVIFNRSMLPSYYAILRMCCQSSRHFALSLARHQNITWAFKNISAYQTQYPAAVEELFKLMQIIVSKAADANEPELSEITQFKRSTLQLYMQILDGRSSWGTLISSFRILIETMEDKLFVIGSNGLNLLFDAIAMLHTMHHEATACHVTGEMVELLTILTDMLRTFRPKEFAPNVPGGSNNNIEEAPVITRYITSAKDWPEVLRKLTTLLNTYNCSDLRNSAIETLIEFLYLMPLDTLRTLVPLMVHCHTACQDAQTSGMGPTLGPYFPKRSSHSNAAMKPAIRPPRPMLQMAFPHLGQETAKGLDEEYDRQLQEFYGQYHVFVDLMCRVGFMKEYVNQELITLSAMLGYEAAPLHFIHFPKLWLEVYNTPSIDRRFIAMLVNTNYFTDYVELVILEERACLTNIVIFNFLATYLPRVFDQIASTDQMTKLLMSLTSDLHNLANKQVVDVETHAMGILGDLKAISLFYLPSINGKGHIPNPLPHPAPTVPQLLGTLRLLSAYLESLVHRKRQDSGSSGQEVPSKRRKMETGIEGAASEVTVGSEASGSGGDDTSTSSTSLAAGGIGNVGNSHFKIDAANQRRYIAQDLIDLLLGTIDSLIRGITPPNGEDMEIDESSSLLPGETVEPGPSSECSTEKAPSNSSANDDEPLGSGISGNSSNSAESIVPQ